MKLKSVLIMFFVLSQLLGYAQEYEFKVLVNKGNNEVKTASGWQSLKIGASLKSEDQIKTSPNSYVGMVHKSGKPIELKEAGTYKLIDLASKLDGSNSIMTKYADFILSSNEDKRSSRLEATGAVHRGLIKVEVFTPTARREVIYSDEIILHWSKEQAAGPYSIRFNSLFGDELDRLETAENHIAVNLNSAHFQHEDNILVSIVPVNDPSKASDQFTLKRASKADKERIKLLLNDASPVVEEGSALGKLLLARYFEENGLLIDAATNYQLAVFAEPGVDTYKQYYEGFLIRNGLKAPSKKK
jgi:hypothetical protein